MTDLVSLRLDPDVRKRLDDIAAYIGQDSPAAASRVILELMERT